MPIKKKKVQKKTARWMTPGAKYPRSKEAVTLYMRRQDFEVADDLVEEVKTLTGWGRFARSTIIVGFFKLIRICLKKGLLNPAKMKDETSFLIALIGALKQVEAQDLLDVDDDDEG
jgi:hypothetical protein